MPEVLHSIRNPHTVAIVQARMGSSRLPGKVLADIGGKPMLHRVVVRARRAQTVGQVVVATTVYPEDDPVAKLCAANGYPCFRGDPIDVLDRYFQAAKLFEAEIIVRLTGDCPLIDPGEIDRTVQAFFLNKVDFTANRLPPPWKRTTPIGMDTEVVSFSALTQAWENATLPYHREHVMPYFYEKNGRFDILLVDDERDLGHYRLTVDTRQDLELVREIYSHFHNQDHFSLEEILDLLDRYPDLIAINKEVFHKSYREIG